MIFLKKYSCEKCDKKFSKQEELMQHHQIVHNKDLPYDCKECNQFFSSMEEMRSHLQRNHSYKKDRI
jgi:KRAB domain-containing zinc finger protein